MSFMAKRRVWELETRCFMVFSRQGTHAQGCALALRAFRELWCQDLSTLEVKRPEDFVHCGDEVKCFIKQRLGCVSSWRLMMHRVLEALFRFLLRFRKGFVALTMLDTFRGRLRVSELERPGS